MSLVNVILVAIGSILALLAAYVIGFNAGREDVLRRWRESDERRQSHVG